MVQTTEFEDMKKLLAVQVVKSNEQLDKKRPTLLVGGEEGCEAPKKLYKTQILLRASAHSSNQPREHLTNSACGTRAV